MNRIKFAAVVFASLLAATVARAQIHDTASANDTARFLAGMQVSATSPLAPLTQDAGWQQHASQFDTTFGNFEQQQLSKIREWSSANLKTTQPLLFYLFSGPDFLYADAFFPNASTYVLAGLEPIGPIPQLTRMPRWTVSETLRNIRTSLGSIMSVSYFITKNMKEDLNSGTIHGTLPILYVFLARTGNTIRDVTLINIDDHGVLQAADAPGVRVTARGVRITFTDSSGRTKTLYYFTVSLSDEPRGIAFLQFCRQLGRGDSFIKSASYLMHLSGFSQTRNFLLQQSELILQDDSGIPIGSFEAGKWRVQPFGRYTGPLNIFQEHYQPRMTELYQINQPKSIGFGIGYSSRYTESNLQLAVRNSGAPDLSSPRLKDAKRQRRDIDPSANLKKAKTLSRAALLENEGEAEIY